MLISKVRKGNGRVWSMTRAASCCWRHPPAVFASFAPTKFHAVSGRSGLGLGLGLRSLQVVKYLQRPSCTALYRTATHRHSNTLIPKHCDRCQHRKSVAVPSFLHRIYPATEQSFLITVQTYQEITRNAS